MRHTYCKSIELTFTQYILGLSLSCIPPFIIPSSPSFPPSHPPTLQPSSPPSLLPHCLSSPSLPPSLPVYLPPCLPPSLFTSLFTYLPPSLLPHCLSSPSLPPSSPPSFLLPPPTLHLRYEDEVYLEWTEGVDEIAKANLDKPLIVRDPSTLHIHVNFDPQVRVKCLAE